jgi:hypothetical protein
VAPFSLEIQKADEFFKPRLLKKDYPPEKCHFLLGIDLLEKEIINITSNFT